MNLTEFPKFSNYSFQMTNITINDSVDFSYPLWGKVIFGIFIFPIIFFSITGNILVIIAITKYSYLRITNNIFLASLAVADLSVAILAMTMNALQLLSGHWYLKSFMCRFWFSCDVLFSTSSILHLFCVSFDRYLSISDEYAFYYNNEDPTKSWRVRIMISGVWIISLLISTVPIFTDFFTTREHSLVIDSLDENNGACMFIVNFPYRIMSSFISFWLPAILMIIFYTVVMKKANNMEKNRYVMYNSIKKNNQPQSLIKATQAPDGSLSYSYTNSSRGSSNRSSGDVVWKRNYKVLIQKK